MPYGQVDRLCKLVPMNPANPVTLAQAIAGEPRLQEARDAEPIVAKLLDIGQRLEGLYRHASTHAAGVVIADRPLIDLVPLYRDARAQLPATQFSMKWAEAAGLVSSIFSASRPHRSRKGAEADRAAGSRSSGTLPLDDPAATRCCKRATRQVFSSKVRACAMRSGSSSPTASRTSSRSWRSTGRGRWTTSIPT
jgi:DNA polymerase-3 subunit alpha